MDSRDAPSVPPPGPWPLVGAAVRVSSASGTSARTVHLEGREGPLLTLLAAGRRDRWRPGAGDRVLLEWTIPQSAVSCRVLVLATSDDTPSRWQVRAEGPPIEVQRRRWLRVHQDRQVVLTVDGRRIPGRLLDRSEHGMRCAIPTSSLLQIDDVVDVAINDREAIEGARVVRVQVLDGQVQIGLSF